MYQTKALFLHKLSVSKGKELFHNNKGHLTWYSRAQGVSIRIQGEVQKIDASISDNYLHLEIATLKFQQVFLNSQKQLKVEKYLMLNLKNLQMIMKVKKFPDLIIGEELYNLKK